MMSQLCSFVKEIAALSLLILLPLSLSCQGDVMIADKSETRVVVDSFVQVDMIDELDILVVVDTSGSMRDNFDDVGLGMETLRIDIENLTLDYQFGFITADPTNSSFVGPYSSTSSSIDILLAASLLNNTFYEEGFAATHEFLRSEAGLSFSRPQSDFLLFLISDEDEQSSISSELFQEFLQSEFSEVNHDVVAITTIMDGLCGHSYDIGWKYTELASLYGKNSIDICGDWTVWLSESSFITQQKDHIDLSESDPIVSSIVVYVDNSFTYEWEYIEEFNRVQLDSVPDYGSLIEVGYKVNI
jgi:hypothetical protein